jgi:hypothetical protein
LKARVINLQPLTATHRVSNRPLAELMSGQHQPLQKSSARSRINRGKRLSRRWLSQQRTHQRRLMQEAALARAVGGAEPELTVLPGASIPVTKARAPTGR